MPQAAAAVVGWVAAPLVGLLGEGAAIAVASFAVNAVAYSAGAAALSAGAGLMRGKAKSAVAERQAMVTTLSLGEVPREAVIGLTCVGGSLVDIFNWGGQYGTDKVTRNVALADHAVEDLYGYLVDDVFYPYLGPGVQPGFNGKLTIDFRNATADGHAPPDYALANGWEATDRMTAVTHAWVTTEFDEKVWPQGPPKFRFVMHGLCCFDPRNGDNWADRSTHSFTRNPMLQRYAIARGIYAEGRQGEAEHLLIGRGLSEDQAPLDRLIANANLCEEYVGELFRYYCDGVISAAMDFITIEQMFADAVAGSIIQPEGGVEVEPGHAKAAVVTITDADLVVGEAVGFSRFLSDKDGGRINTVVPRYVDPAQNWSDHSGPVRRDLADIVKDGGPREMTLTMPLVTGAAVADRNAEIARKLARLERRATIVLPPEFSWLEEGDWIAWQSDRRHKGATVRYRIESWSLDEQWRMRLSLREIASSVYGVPDPVEDLAEPPPAPVPVDALTLPGASAEAILLAGETSVIPAIRFTWDTPVDGAMRAVRGEVRVAGDTDASPTRFEDLGEGVGIATNGVAADQVLQARLVPLGDPTRPVLPSVWFTVTTGQLVAGDAANWGGRPATELTRLIDQQLGTLEQLLALANDRAASAQQETRDRETAVRDNLDRLSRLAEIDPIEGSVIVRRDTQFEEDDGSGASTLTVIRSQIDGAIAVSASEGRTFTNGRIAEATANLVTIAALGEAIAGADLSLRSWTNGRISEATASLATLAAVGEAIAASALTLRSYTDDEISEATASLVTTATMTGAISDAGVTLRSYTDGKVATATAGLATLTQVGTAVAQSLIDAKSYTDDLKTQSDIVFTTKAQFNGLTGPTGVITVLQSAVATAEGKINLTYGFSLNAGGRVAGMLAVNDGTTSSIDFEADAFRVWSGSAAVPAFGIIDGQVYIAGNRVGTHSLIPNAVTKGASARDLTETTVSPSVWTDLLSCAMGAGGGEVSIDFGAQVSLVNTAGPNAAVYIAFARDGVDFDAMQIMDVLGSTNAFIVTSSGPSVDGYVQINTVISTYVHPFTVDVAAAAGAHTWTVRLWSACGATVGAKQIRLLETRR